jgi:hypothetical protein
MRVNRAALQLTTCSSPRQVSLSGRTGSRAFAHVNQIGKLLLEFRLSSSHFARGIAIISNPDFFK